VNYIHKLVHFLGEGVELWMISLHQIFNTHMLQFLVDEIGLGFLG